MEPSKDIKVLSDPNVDWDLVKKNRKSLAKINRIGRKAYVFHVGLAILVLFIAYGLWTREYADVALFLGAIMAAYTGLASVFLFAVHKDKQTGSDGINYVSPTPSEFRRPSEPGLVSTDSDIYDPTR